MRNPPSQCGRPLEFGLNIFSIATAAHRGKCLAETRDIVRKTPGVRLTERLQLFLERHALTASDRDAVALPLRAGVIDVCVERPDSRVVSGR